MYKKSMDSQMTLKSVVTTEMLTDLPGTHTRDSLNRIPTPDWHLQGNCYDTGYELFFPEDKDDARVKTPQAKSLCTAPCPVRKQCLQYALETKSDYGTWGGATRFERKKIQEEMSRRGMTVKEWINERFGQDGR